jgi:myo-inositol-1(or 4)-monophosphatase
VTATLMQTPVPRDVLDVGIAAARLAGDELADRFGRAPRDVRHPDLIAAAAVADVIGKRRPSDSIRAAAGSVERAGATGLRWLISPLDGRANYLAGIPLYCVSIACEDASGTLAGVILDPFRDELFAAVRGGPVRIDGAQSPGNARAAIASALLTGGVTCATKPEARRAAKLDKRLFRRVAGRRTLGSTALELAWTAAGRFDACFHEQRLDAWDVDAGLFIARRAGLRAHRLPPLEDGLAPRLLVAREPLAAELLELIGPGPKVRRRAVTVL